MQSQRTMYSIISVLVAGLLISTTAAAYYAYENGQSKDEANTYLAELKQVQPTQSADILLDFGNGTLRWYNDTEVQTGSNAYVATVVVTHGVVNATWYAEYSEHLVNGIDNVQNTAQQSWFIWTYNATARWQVAQVGADLLPVVNGTIFAWTFCAYNPTTYVPTCTP